MSIAESVRQVYRDFNTDGVPDSLEHEPIKAEIRDLLISIVGGEIAAVQAAVALGSMKLYPSIAAMNADLVPVAGIYAMIVAAGADLGKIYVKVGGTGTGSWSFVTIFADITDLEVRVTAAEGDITTAEAAIALKAPIASPTFTGTVGGITKAMVGLGNADNTSDVAKPISTAQQTALDLKANIASPTFTGVPAAPTATVATDSTQLATTAFTHDVVAVAPVSPLQQTAIENQADIARVGTDIDALDTATVGAIGLAGTTFGGTTSAYSPPDWVLSRSLLDSVQVDTTALVNATILLVVPVWRTSDVDATYEVVHNQTLDLTIAGTNTVDYDGMEVAAGTRVLVRKNSGGSFRGNATEPGATLTWTDWDGTNGDIVPVRASATVGALSIKMNLRVLPETLFESTARTTGAVEAVGTGWRKNLQNPPSGSWPVDTDGVTRFDFARDVGFTELDIPPGSVIRALKGTLSTKSTEAQLITLTVQSRNLTAGDIDASMSAAVQDFIGSYSYTAAELGLTVDDDEVEVSVPIEPLTAVAGKSYFFSLIGYKVGGLAGKFGLRTAPNLDQSRIRTRGWHLKGSTLSPVITAESTDLGIEIDPPSAIASAYADTSAEAILGPWPFASIRFESATLPLGWSKGANVTVVAGTGVSATGGSVGAATNLVQFDKYSSASNKRLVGRFRCVDDTAKFAILNRPLGAGAAVVVDGTAGNMIIYIYDVSLALTSTGPGQTVALTAPLVNNHEYLLTIDYGELVTTATLVDTLTHVTTTLVDNFAANGVRRQWHGKPAVGMTGGNICRRFDAYTAKPKRLRTIIYGDSLAEGSSSTLTPPSWAHILADSRTDILISAQSGSETNRHLLYLQGDLPAHRPSHVVLALGTNETVQDDWRKRLKGLIRICEYYGAQVTLTTYSPYGGKQTLIDAMNSDIMLGYFGDYDYIDIAAAVTIAQDRVTWVVAYNEGDNVHITTAGNVRVAVQALLDAPYIAPPIPA